MKLLQDKLFLAITLMSDAITNDPTGNQEKTIPVKL
jgi:hypothetical protein